ncbi:TadE/TadG family type IV pilus assembly protein [Pelosinus fermentans]|uniref:TadE family protein n=1 Tax=Pelosinus fermentans JBW45 TaxID=1192197 RepID=I9NM20_9FIRM|nr:TadE/TadG family type IV pilus assembly protein [Pelosinus fermentans]AJQ26833.1 TadE family protein [Pelosinus fermentans JBW45]
MRYLRNKRGQAMVEFAIIIPFFIFMMYGFSYLGMFFHDYLTLNEMTRDITRQASVGISLDKIKESYSNKTFLTSVYTFDSDAIEMTIASENEKDTSDGQNVTVKLTAWLNMESGFWKSIFPEKISSSLTMRKEE